MKFIVYVYYWQFLYSPTSQAQTNSDFLPTSARWPDGTRLPLEPEDDDDQSASEGDEPKRKVKKEKAKAKAKAKDGKTPRPRVKKSDSGRTIETEYYNHPSLQDMPVTRPI